MERANKADANFLEPITRSFPVSYKPYEASLFRVVLFLEGQGSQIPAQLFKMPNQNRVIVSRHTLVIWCRAIKYALIVLGKI